MIFLEYVGSRACLSAGKQLFGCFFVFMEGDDSDILKRKRGVSNVFIEFWKERCSSGWRGTPGKRVYAKSVSRVRIPLSPLNVLDRNGQQTDKKLQINDLWLFLLPESPASKTSKVR